ncbi:MULTISPECIES: peptidoglycan-binding protein [unclassified Streptomyces]|uniref:peptidoglycan-binding protein n=1 Tax=unclassified Streptomyces TaxID=2593676 RepID=UPI00225A682A|nr:MULTISPECIES: peptidoglycan-binding protein [unclassified Streptomyces]MCX5140454.1 peptidoglycan-binding protein [Streptomyces sp. NBC_00338]WRZ65007.1 peptidoglycan-binding protein [Streptomyces sp. NBC_01257]WSU59007.1 peptidoglycan-binding protein [Streptomyces sp. NBC_01104]
MTVPAFEEYVPAIDCTCAGCAVQRRTAAAGLPTRHGGHPAAHGARRAMVLVTAAGVVLSAGLAESASAAVDPAPVADPGAAADTGPATDTADPGTGPDSPQGGPGPLQGAGASGPPASQTAAPALRKTTRADIINRAKKWVAAQVPYSMEKYWSDGYRQDCSGYVSMAWNLAGNEWTGSLATYGTRIAREDLQPGDILLFHNPADPAKGSHVTIFGGWTDYTHTHYTAYEQTKPHTRKQTTPMAYWSNSGSYVAYRYKGLTTGTGGSGSTTTPFPGAGKFGGGADNAYVTQLGKMLVGRGGKRFYKVGPGPAWSSADRQATQAFQKAQGWKGKEADGIPGPDTWRLLVNGTGHDIPAAGGSGGSTAVPAFPGRSYFRPGQSNSHVDKLGKQLVKKGYGKYYLSGPGPRWTEADRRNVEAFQKAQGWRGTEADGYPGPETWRRLFA